MQLVKFFNDYPINNTKPFSSMCMQLVCKNIRLYFLLLLFFILSGIKGNSHPRHLQLKQLTTDHGLSSSSIVSMLQDHNGFMWIGTTEGLNRYDGNTFKVYKQDLSDASSLPDNLVISLLQDNENRIFIGTNAGLSLYDADHDCFINYKNDSSSCLYGLAFQGRDIEKGPNNSLYVATNIGLLHFSPNQNTYEFINLPIEFTQEKKVLIDALCIDRTGKLWIGTKKGLLMRSTDGKSIVRIDKGVDGSKFSKVRFNRIVEDKKGTIWASSYHNGLFKVEEFPGSYFQLVNYRHEPGDPTSISKNRLLSLHVDCQNHLWIGAENDGIFLYIEEEENFKQFLSSDTDPLYTHTYSVESLYEDISGNLWIGTFAHGVNITSKNSDAIVAYKRFKGGDLSITNNMVNAFSEDVYGKIWVGTDGGGLNILDKETGLFTNLNTSNSDLPNDYILSILEEKNNEIWMSTWGSGLMCYNRLSNTFTSFNKENSAIPDNNIFCLTRGKEADFWLSTYGNGLVRFYENGKVEQYSTANSKINDNYVNTVSVTSWGEMYVGTRSGLQTFNPKTKKFRDIPLVEKESETLSTLHVYDILVESDTSVWVATLLGLNHLNPVTGKNMKYTMENGLPSNVVRGILKDKLGDLWFSTTGGICRYRINEDKYSVFTKADGLQSNEFRPRSAWLDKEGDLYFGGVNGFSIIHPKRIISNSKIPDVRITGLDLFNQPAKEEDIGAPLNHILYKSKELKLNHNQSVLTFHFGVLDYTQSEKNQHAYLLENFDNDWTNCGSRREVTYTNLDPGKYVLRIKGANNDGVWNEEGTHLHITVVPPWWASWWFKLAVVFFIAASAFVTYYVRVSALERQKELLEQTVEKRTRELAEINSTKDKLFSIVAHDLRSPFNAILGFTNLLYDNFDSFDTETTRTIMRDLKTSTENAFVLLENLLSWSQSQQNQIKFKPKKIALENYFPKILEEFETLLKRKNIEIQYQIAKKKTNVYADLNMLSLILRNLITNAVKYSNAGGKVSVQASVDKTGWVTFCVSDQGIGIAPRKVGSLFKLGEHHSVKGTNGEQGTGLGLILCKEFVELHKGKIWVESKLKKGSDFYFTIPKSAKKYNIL